MNFQTSQGNSRVTQQYEDDYEQDGEHRDLQIIVQQKQPHQKLISLTNLQLSNETHSQFRNQKDDIEQKQKLISKLKGILNLKIEQIKQIKKNITNCKKQIKEIGQQVDKQMNKSILKHSKPHANINIKQIFQTTKSSDPQINKLSSELEKVRYESKKVKMELKAIQTQIKSPINLINSERAIQMRSKIKQAQIEIKNLKQQKQFLDQQVKMNDIDEGSNQILNDQQFKNNRQKNAQIFNEVKEEKNKLYQLQKQDRVLTEKIRYIGQLEEQVEIKKNKTLNNSIISKEQAEIGIKQIIEQINQMLQKRNKIQTQKKNLYKSLETDVATIEAKNWEIINKLRQIDAKLIKHYNTKLKKSKAKKQNANQISAFQDIQKPKQKEIESYGNTMKTVYSGVKNDKNFQPAIFQSDLPVLVEKRKAYQFFMNTTDNQSLGNIILNDEMLGNKLAIKRLSFQLDQNTLYGMSADYINEHKNQVRGYKIMSRIKPKDLLTKTLIIDQSKNQVLNYVHIGIDKDQCIKYLHIITSEAKQFKWGNLQICEKNQQKNIRKYQNIVIKGKLNQIGDKEAPNYYSLAGLGFTIVYLSPK